MLDCQQNLLSPIELRSFLYQPRKNALAVNFYYESPHRIILTHHAALSNPLSEAPRSEASPIDTLYAREDN